jgi:hypothetical protein
MNLPDPQAVRDALASAPTASDALRALYELAKAADRRASLAYLCRRAGIPSTGNFADVLSGKRRLAARYAEGVAVAFGLAPAEARLLTLLLRLDHERDAEGRARLVHDLEALRRIMRVRHVALPTDALAHERAGAAAFFLATEVFAALGLFANRATRDDLVGWFGRERYVEVERALGFLVASGAVAREAEGGISRYVPTTTHLALDAPSVADPTSPPAVGPIDVMDAALADARRALPGWFARSKVAHFESAIISVRRDAWEAKLRALKDELLAMQSALEFAPADGLVRFSVQIYPVGEFEGQNFFVQPKA